MSLVPLIDVIWIPYIHISRISSGQLIDYYTGCIA